MVHFNRLFRSWPAKLAAIAIATQLLGCASQATDTRQFVLGPDDVTIAYETTGAGKIGLIFVHGWSCDRSYWREQLVPFSDSYQVVAVDLAGHGDSGADRDDWSIKNFGGDVAAVATEIDAEHIILVGHSMGGPVVLEAALQLDDRVIAVVGVDVFRNAAAEPMNQQQAERAFNTPASIFAERTETMVRRAFFIESSPTELVDQIALDMANGDPVVAAKAGVSLMTFNLREALHALRHKPVTLINADYRPTDRDALNAVHPATTLATIPNAGHFVMLEQPSAFNETLAAEIDRVVSQIGEME